MPKLQILIDMSKKALIETFSKRYSFISRPNSYYILQKNRQLQNYWRSQKESLSNRLPPNLRLSKLTPYEKMIASAVITFFCTVKYLENFS